MSLPVQGAWIEIGGRAEGSSDDRRSLPVQGAWIEIAGRRPLLDLEPSLPVQGAWIEIFLALLCRVIRAGRSPCRERGLKSCGLDGVAAHNCRSPCRERGLKFFTMTITGATLRSLPVQGAWIEIEVGIHMQTDMSSLPVQGAWIEMYGTTIQLPEFRRSPCRERGLKFIRPAVPCLPTAVAPRAGSVD